MLNGMDDRQGEDDTQIFTTAFFLSHRPDPACNQDISFGPHATARHPARYPFIEATPWKTHEILVINLPSLLFCPADVKRHMLQHCRSASWVSSCQRWSSRHLLAPPPRAEILSKPSIVILFVSSIQNQLLPSQSSQSRQPPNLENNGLRMRQSRLLWLQTRRSSSCHTITLGIKEGVKKLRKRLWRLASSRTWRSHRARAQSALLPAMWPCQKQSGNLSSTL